MSLLTLQQVSKSYFGKTVLDRISFNLDDGERLALIGSNGAGKTTLLRLIAGLEKPDTGSITLAATTILGYLAQHFEDSQGAGDTALVSREIQQIEDKLRDLELQMAAGGQKVMLEYSRLTAKFEAAGGYAFSHRIKETLAGLGLAGDILERPLEQLSGGERMRVALARLLLKSPNLLLLDEPTNHLDMAAMEWLEDYLTRFKGAVLLISHDRAFIDRTATSVAELSGGSIVIRPGNYTQFKAIEAAKSLTQEREAAKLSRELERQKQVTQTMLSHRKMSSYHAREKVVEKLSGKLSDIQARAKKQNLSLNFNFLPGQAGGDPDKVILQTRDLTAGYGETPLFSNVSMTIQNGMKVCLCGPNGCGKSTLLALLLGRIEAFDGQVRLAPNLIYGHMGQHVDFEDDSRTLLNEMLSRADLDEGQARSLLARYGFRDVDIQKKIGVLSGGERSRLYLAVLLLERPDILFLDEPTNHLDIYSREILEQSLQDFPGAILSVSHDRYFIERCCDLVLGFIRDSVLPFDNYSDYRKAEATAQSEPDPEQAAGTEPKQARPDRKGRSNKAHERREVARRKEQHHDLELAIHALESEKAQLEQDFSADTSPEAYQHYADLLSELDRLYEDYLDLEQA